MFRDYFKYYKSKNPLPNFDGVVDMANPLPHQVREVTPTGADESLEFGENPFGLTSADCWRIFQFPKISGLIFIRNPFTSSGQRYWITRCLRDYSRRPNRLNIDAHGFLGERDAWWDICTRGDERASELIPKLRWATLGYHHNWDTKHYSETDKTEIPRDLNHLTRTIAKSLGFDDFTAEAAIINYYRMNSTLAGHVDHSEDYVGAPLVSISFGQSAVFLIGGLKPEDPATPIFLRSGDVVVMSGESRLRYHGVPKIVKASKIPWDDEAQKGDIYVDYEDWRKARKYISEARINMNVRQVLEPGQKALNSCGVNS